MSEGILVTGATGFIGAYLVRQLVGADKEVRVFVRRPEALSPALCDRIEVIRGDLGDRAALRKAVEGTRTVMHLAACARAWSPRPAEFRDANVRAVEWLLDAARRSDVRSLVHVSTALTRRLAAADQDRSEVTPYERSKLEGERLVEAYAAEGRRAVIVHPTRVYGPGPLTDANGVTKLISLYLRGRFRFRIADGDVRANYVHAADVAQGIRLAAEHGRAGAHYILGGAENLSLRAFLDRIAELSGVRRRVVALPPAVSLCVAAGGELWGRLGGQTSLTRAWVRVFLEDLPFDISRERAELGYRPCSLGSGLLETIEWLRASGRQRRRDGRRDSPHTARRARRDGFHAYRFSGGRAGPRKEMTT